MPLSFAPWHFFPIAIVSPAILLYCWHRAAPLRAAWRGLLFGLGYFGFGASWVYISIHHFGHAQMPIAILLTFLFVTYLATYIAIGGFLLQKYCTHTETKLMLGFPALWVLIEIVRGSFFSGFPWLSIGYSHIVSPLRHFAPLSGVYSVSWLSLLTSAALVTPFISLSRARFGFMVLILALWIFAPFVQHEWTKSNHKPISIAMIQGNISQELKWLPGETENIIQTYITLTEPLLDREIVFWPEAAIPMSQLQAHQLIAGLDSLAKEHHTTLVLGIPLQYLDTFYNGLLVLGEHSGEYHKRHLVPFGEYLPLQPLSNWVMEYLRIPMSNFTPGANKQPPISIHDTIFAPFICYEIVFPNLVRQSLPQANVLFTITDDSWFGESFAAVQHVDMMRMRALETGRYHLSVTNNGVTAIIDHHGTMLSQIPAHIEGTLTGEIESKTGSTPWVMLGSIPLLLLLSLSVLLAIVSSLFSRTRSQLRLDCSLL